MNSHNPFNTGGDGGCTNDFRSADQLVDRIIGDAYHVVKEVYLALGNLTYIYNYLQKYGLIITVDSEDAIKDIPLSIGKFARVYNKSDSAGYYFTDYLYVEDDRTGIIPNDSTATGSWISTKSTGSNASFVRIWKYRAVADGETIIQLPTDVPIVAVQTIYVQGIRQDVGEGFIYNEGNATLTLADELEVGNLVTVIMGISDLDMDIDVFEVLKNADGASNIGTSAGITVEEALSANNANAREQWRRQLSDAGFSLVDGSFEQGAEVGTPLDAVWYMAEGQCYIWGGDLPKTVPAKSTPQSTGGISNSAWKSLQSQTTLTALAKVNGLQKIGRANTAAALRAYEPATSGEVLLADINGLDYWYYDDTDTTTPDNGYFCVVTADGKRWRRNNSKDYIDLSWLGLKPGVDVQPYWQAAIDIIHTAALAQLSIYDLPYIRVQGGTYLLSGTVTTPPYISTVFTKDTKLVADALVDGTHEAAVVIYCNDAVNLYDNNRSSSFPKTITCSAGKIRLVREGSRATTNPIGLYTKGATSTAHAINMRISDLEVYGAFRAGHGNTATRTWLMRFDNCQFNGFYGIAYYGTNIDSGERITYNNCVISGGYNDATTKAIYMETSGINIHLLSCSIDFTGGDIIYLTPSAKWCNIEVEDSHIESWNGYLVNAESTSNVARFVTFRGTNLLPTGSLGYAQSLSRKLLKGAACKVLFDDCFISWTVYPYDSYDSIIETGSTLTVRARNHKDLALGLHPFTTDNRLLRVYNFTSEVVGNVLTSNTATTTTTTVRKYGSSFSSVTVVIVALDNSLIDTTLGSGTTNTLQLTWGSGGYAYIEAVEKVRVTPGCDYGMKATVIMPDLTSKLNLAPAIAWYDENDNLIAKTEVFYSDMNQIVNQSISGVAAYPSRANKRVACRTSSVKAPAGAAYARGVMQLTNGTAGSVYYLTDYNLFISPTN